MAHLDTISTVHDMDVLRAVLGDKVLTYYGASYGTYLGAWYAQEFPWRVGRLVLDGAVDPSLTSAQYSEGQALGFSRAVRSYVKDCLANDGCPLRGTVDDAYSQLESLLARTDETPLRTSSGRPLTQARADGERAAPAAVAAHRRASEPAGRRLAHLARVPPRRGHHLVLAARPRRRHPRRHGGVAAVSPEHGPVETAIVSPTPRRMTGASSEDWIAYPTFRSVVDAAKTTPATLPSGRTNGPPLLPGRTSACSSYTRRVTTWSP